jgi:hypothetical protein
MEADDLVGRGPFAEPVGERGVQARALGLREVGVSGLANQGVPEAKRVLAGELGPVGADQPLAHKSHERRGEALAPVLGRQVR